MLKDPEEVFGISIVAYFVFFSKGGCTEYNPFGEWAIYLTVFAPA